MKIASARGFYEATFVNDFTVPLKKIACDGAVAVVDSVVAARYRRALGAALGKTPLIAIRADENTKTLDGGKALIEGLVARGFRRNQRIIAIGGGVVQDVVGFSASVLYRGVEWVFFPTTLLAQADSCIGSKTSINLASRKNLVGTFYPPRAIYLDQRFLETLSVDDIKSGIGEMFHFYLYADSPYFNRLISNYQTLLKNRKLLSPYIRESLAIKKAVVEADEFDRGERNKFNYGHTFGHALESATNYGIKHGQAVTVGMDLANYISYKTGLMDEAVFRKLHAALTLNFPAEPLRALPLDRYFTALSKDKKNIGANIGCILAAGPGKLVKKQIPADAGFRSLVKAYFML